MGGFNGGSLIQLGPSLLTLHPGQEQQGVTLLQAWDRGAQVRYQGRVIQLPTPAAQTKIQTHGTLVAGQIGALDVSWRIDTGASDVVISQQMAQRIGAPMQAIAARIEHAQGFSPAWQMPGVNLVLGPWKLPPTRVVVVPGAHPKQPLFGLAGLKHFELHLQHSQLTLTPIPGSGIMPSHPP